MKNIALLTALLITTNIYAKSSTMIVYGNERVTITERVAYSEPIPTVTTPSTYFEHGETKHSTMINLSDLLDAKLDELDSMSLDDKYYTATIIQINAIRRQIKRLEKELYND